MVKNVHAKLFECSLASKIMNIEQADPQKTITKAYQMKNLSSEDCRTVFMVWALSVDGDDIRHHAKTLLNKYAKGQPSHPLTELLQKTLIVN